MSTTIDIASLLHQIPAGVHIGMAGAFFAGLIVWAFGSRLFRPMLLLASAVTGAGVGFVAAAIIPWDIGIWWYVGAGALLAGVMSLASYRYVMAILLAASLGAACPLVFFPYAELTGQYADEPAGDRLTAEELRLPGIPQTVTEQMPGVKEFVDQHADQLNQPPFDSEQSAPDGTSEASWRQHLQRTSTSVLRYLAQEWKDAPGRQRLMAVFISAGGILGGFLMGLFMPKFAASIVTTLVGSAIFLTSGSWLVLRFGIPWIPSLFPHSGASVLYWWLGATVIGLAIQLSPRPKKADKT